MKQARMEVLAQEIVAQRERIHAEFDYHKAAILADAELDFSRAFTDNRTSLRTELHALDDAHLDRKQGMDDFERTQRVQIEKIAAQLLAVARSQKSHKIVQDSNQNMPLRANFNIALPFHSEPLPGLYPE